MIGWQYFFPVPATSPATKEEVAVKVDKPNTEIKQAKIADDFNLPTSYVIETTKSTRVFFENGKIEGSINPIGLKIDNLILKNYSNQVQLLNPSEAKNVYFAQFGFASNDAEITMPNSATLWNLTKKDSKIIATWKNPQGITFEVTFILDENYMFDVQHKVYNLSGKEIGVSAFIRIFRSEGEGLEKTFISHEGFIGAFNNRLNELKYSKVKDVKRLFYPKQSEIVWAGFVDKYWLTAFFFPDVACINTCNFINSDISFNYILEGNVDKFQSDLITDEVKIKNGSTLHFPSKFFAGAKELKVLDKYESEGFKINDKHYPLKYLENAIDYGIFYFLTKPILLLIQFLNSFVHNFGVSIILLTIIIKFLLYPIAKKSYISMAKMKMVAPEIEIIRKQTPDKLERNRRIIDVYRRNEVNPLAGCLPIVLQIPVFFALYKVLFISIEMKGTPFIWWIQDLSSKDPTSFINLFGLLPFDVPAFLQIGVLPILMGLTTFLQQRLSPKNTQDPTQAMILKTMPFILIFVFASFPAGIVLYWIVNNILSILQQLYVEKVIVPKIFNTFQKKIK